MGMCKEARVRNAIGDREKEEDMASWERWGKLKAPEKWKWLTELRCCPRRGPDRASTEDLGSPQVGGEEPLRGTEIEGGITERSNELIDRTKEPKLTVAE